MNNNLKQSLISLGITILVLGVVGGLVSVKASSLLEQLSPKVFVQGNYIEAPASNATVQVQGPRLGSAATSADQITTWTGGGSFGGDLTVGGNITISGSSTINYMVGGENTLFSSFNAASTTVCSVQNTSGQDRIITSAFINLAAGTSANTVNSVWRGYTSVARADNNTNATGTLFKAAALNTSTLAVAYGGLVPSMNYVSSTALLNANGGTTTTPVMWYNGTYANVTTTAITSSTGSCVFYYQPFTNN